MATAQQGIMALPEMSQQAASAAISPEQMAAFDQIRQTVSPKEFSDELLSSASQADPQAVAEFKQALEEMDVPAEVLDLINQLVDEVLANPENYEAIKQKYLAQGVTDDILPEQFDPEFFAALNVAVDQLRGEPAGPQAFAKGGIAELKPIAKALASYGRNGDTMLAHITPAEARMLKKRGGSGTVNPVTGLPEFFLKKVFSKIGNAVKKFTRSTVGRIVTTVALGFLLGPAAASMLGVGAGTAAGAAISGFVGSAGSTLLAGGSVRDALKAGAVAGITAGTGAALFGDMPLTGPAEMTAKEAFQTQVGKVANFFDAPAKVYTEAAGPSLPSQPELPTMPGSQAPAAVNVPDKYDLLPDSFGEARAVERATTSGVPSVGTVAPPAVTAPASTAVTGGDAVQQAVSAKSAVPTVGQSIKTIGEGLGLGQGPASWETFKQGVSDLFLPQGASQEAIDLKVNDLMAKNPRMPYADALKRVTGQMTPGIMRSYGPMAAAGLGIMGLTGGFQQREVKSPYSDLFTGGPGSARDLLARNPYQYYIQNLPGVTYYGGSVLPPPGYAHGGEVQHFSNGGETLPSAAVIGQQAALQTPAVGTVASAPPAATAPLTQVGIAAAPTTQVATPTVGGYNMYSPAAQNMYYGVVNQGLLGGYQYNPQTRRNEPVTSLPSVEAPYNTTAPYASLVPAEARATVMPPSPMPRRAPMQFPTGERLAEIEGSYRSLLGRDPDVAGLMAFGSPQYNLSMEDIRGMMLASPERQRYLAQQAAAQAPAPEAVMKPITVPFVEPRARPDPVSGLPRIAAQNVAAVEPTKPIIISSTAPAGYDYSAAPVVTDRERQINDLYRSILNRDAETAGLKYWAGSGLSISEIEAQIRKIAGDIGVPLTLPQNVPVADVSRPVTISSTAPVGYDYAAAPVTNEREQQINDIYRRVLNRDAESGGLNYWRDSGLSLPEIEAQIRKIAGDIGVTVAAPRPVASSGGISTIPKTPTGGVVQRNMGGIASLGAGGYPRRTGQIDGPGTATSDSIPAMLSDGEFVMTAKAVRGAGGGDRRKGAKKMYALMHQLERNASRG
jgi:hypothetical protein